MKRCSKCGNETFIITRHVTSSVIVDGYGDFIKEVSSCDEITHAADDNDIWNCAKCGYSDAGSAFNVEG